MENLEEQIKELQKIVDTYDNIVFFGGAGVSTESGIPDFRSVDGLYHQQYDYPPETILSHSFYRSHPEEFFRFYRNKMLFPKAQPNAAHKKLAELERAGKIGYLMHTTAMRLPKPGVTEKFVGGQVDGIANSYGAMVSFPTIFSQHGEIMHGNPSMAVLEAGRLALCDAGAETVNNYCSDHTRTMPVSGKFTQRQLEIYSIVEACHDYVLEVAKPGVKYMDVHFAVCRLMTERLKELGLMKGDTDEAVRAGAHAMFLPHGLGHMMGMDVHDMENLDQINVGFDEETKPNLEQFGTNCLRMGRRLEEGFVVTDEPGRYFIPALIDNWKASGHCKEFLNFDKLETYKDFGGIRIEDDVLITADGCRFIGDERIPYHAKDVEAFMANN